MPYVPAPSGARYHYELYGDGEEKVLFMGGFACCKGYWKASTAHLLNKGKLKHSASASPAVSSSSSSSPRVANGSPSHAAALPTSTSFDFLRAPSSRSTPVSPATPKSPISLSTQPVSATSGCTNRYQIAVFDTRGFGETSTGSLTARYSTSSMALDTLAILLHLGWVRPKREESPFWALRRKVGQAEEGSTPLLHIVSWSLGGMIAQELSFLLLSSSSHLSQRLISLVFTSSSPGGYRSPDEPTTSYLVRNQPPWEGWKLIMRILFGAWTNEGRIKYTLRLHFSKEYLARRFEGVWPVVDEEECFCVEGCEKAAVRRMAREQRREERQEQKRMEAETNGHRHANGKEEAEQNGHAGLVASISSSTSLSSIPSQSNLSPSSSSSARPLTNADVLAQMYASRSPFDKNVLSYLWSLSWHVIAVYTHAFTSEKFHVLHTYNETSVSSAAPLPSPTSPSSPAAAAAVTTTTRTRESISIPSDVPAPASMSDPHARSVYPLVLTGDGDLLIAPQNSLTLARFLRCPCIVVKDSGHMLYVEQPQLFAGVLHKHFRLSRERREAGRSAYGTGNGQSGRGEQGEGWYEDALVKVVDYTHSPTPDRKRRLSTFSNTLSSASATSALAFARSLIPSPWGVRSFLFFLTAWRMYVSRVRLRTAWLGMRGWFRRVVSSYVVWFERVHRVVLVKLRWYLILLGLAV